MFMTVSKGREEVESGGEGALTRKERLETIFAGQRPDRPAVRLWTAEPGIPLLHPVYGPVNDAAVAETDLLVSSGSEFELYGGVAGETLFHREEEPTDSDEWVDLVTTLSTPDGDLRRVDRESTCKKPGYHIEHLLKEPGDITKLLSMPYDPYPFSTEAFLAKEHAIGDAGIVVFGLDHAMYGLQRQIGSENFALWSLSDASLLVEAVATFADRIRRQVLAAFDAGLQPVFGWVGPELCIPPLMSPTDFRKYVLAFDKPLIDLIHDRGGQVWVHSHGNMGPVIDQFLEMGVDVLNPVEPPPMGDHTLAETFDIVGDRMGLEGNLQAHEMMTASPERLTELIHEALDAGNGRRMILCPTSGFMEVPDPPQRYIDNLMLYIHEGVRYAESLA